MSLSLNLRQRFSLTIFVAIAVASSIMVMTIYWAVSKYTQDYTVHYWQEYAQTFANSAKFSVTLASPDKAIEVASHFKKESIIKKTRILLSSGEILASKGDHAQCSVNTNNTPFSIDSFKTKFILELSNAWCFYAPIYYSDENQPYIESDPSKNPATSLIGFVELVVSKQELNKVIQKILWLSIISVIAFELVIFLTVQYFSDVLTRALLQLSSVMKQTSQGKRGVRATFEGPAEISSLKQRLNQMLDQIEAQEEELEEKVSTRTTELKTALESALSASRYKSKIISTVSHEMKSPLHAFMGYSQLALESLDDTSDPKIKLFLDKGIDSAKNLENQINQILDYARLESGMAQIQQATFTVRSLVIRCVEKIEPLTRHTGNKIELIGNNIKIESDQDKLTHILMNLISNANKFTQNGQITITWSIVQHQLIIQVSDNGCGVPEADQDKIFEPFWQADMSFSRPAGGTGLGLAISKLYAELLSGNITVDSSETGSVFTVMLPIEKAQAAHHHSEELPE